MQSILRSSGDPDVWGLNWLRRRLGAQTCADPESPECRRKREDEQRAEDAERRREQNEFLQRMEDEIAVMMRERDRR